MTKDALVHFPLYIGDMLKKFIELPTLEERGAWLSLQIALIQHDGKLPHDETIYYRTLCFSDENKQMLKQVISKCFVVEDGFIISEDTNLLINKQKALREKRRDSGKKGGNALKNKNNKANGIASAQAKQEQVPKQSESESESELNSELESEKKDSDFFKNEGVKEWKSISNYYLTDNVLANARKKAPGWDVYELAKIYDEAVISGRYPQPNNPQGAFIAWCGKYTKGNKL